MRARLRHRSDDATPAQFARLGQANRLRVRGVIGTRRSVRMRESRLVAQAVAAGIQIYAFFGDLGKSERVITLLVLAVTSVQVVLVRPRGTVTPETRSQEQDTSETI